MKNAMKGIKIPLRFVVGETIIAASIQMRFSDLPLELQGKYKDRDFIEKLWEWDTFQEVLGEYQAELGCCALVGVTPLRPIEIDRAVSFGRDGFEILDPAVGKAPKWLKLTVMGAGLITAGLMGFLMGAA